MKVGVGCSELPDSAAAGRQAVEAAARSAGRSMPCDAALLFCTSRVNAAVLRESVMAAIGAEVPIYGGGSVGVITNDYYGYAGDQVGVALIWLDGARLDAVVSPRLKESEEIAGAELGTALAGLGVAKDAQLMIFYDSTRRKGQSTELVMATWLLAAIEKSLGFLPNFSGAGLMGDHRFTPVGQFLGSGIGGQSASVLAFGGVRIDTAIMHGCHPASAYYTVTKADGPVILEINHTPAIQFVNSLLRGSITPNEYPFFLLFGINSGERWAEYDEDSYASRLCCGLEPARGGIVMFEPDMVEGTEFQIMYRSLDLGYMKPKINSLFDNLDGREPVFGMYIDCAGRAAGYGGADLEDAVVLQQTVAGRVPILGIYSGVEIAPLMGRPRGLDWTGVFCLFSTEPRDGRGVPAPRPPATKAKNLKTMTEQEAIVRISEQNLAKALELDSMCIRVRHELELKRRGYRLITTLADSLRQTDDYREVFVNVAQRINATLNMQKTAVLFPSGKGSFKVDVLQGFEDDEGGNLLGQELEVPEELLCPQPVVVTSSRPGHFMRFRAMLNLPYFISSPVIFQGEVMAVLVTGRMVELPPFSLKLSDSDAETVQATTELLGSVLVRLRLQNAIRMAETDCLTGLYNRVALETIVEASLSGAAEKSGTFMMIDLDNFKPVNDTYGHLAGDRVLRACADWMNAVLRDTDIIGRIGGDEFAVFCIGLTDPAQAAAKATQILKGWEKIFPEGGKKNITGSIGIAIAPLHGKTYEDLYKNADAALYQAKAKGRNRCIVFGEEDAPLCEI